MKKRSTLVALAICFLFRSAMADDNANTSAALAKFDEGRKAFDSHDYANARAAFEASNSMLASPNSLLYIARCDTALGKFASAYTTFMLVQRQAEDRITANNDKRYVATRDSAMSEAAEIQTKVPMLTLALPSGLPQGFTVKRNDAVLSEAEFGVAVATDPGHITVDANGPRIKPFHTEFDLQPGEQHRVDVRADRLPTATITLQLQTRPAGLSVQIDGAPADASAYLHPIELDTGVRKIDVTAPGYKHFHWQKDLANGEMETVPITLAAEPRGTTIQRTGGTPSWLFFATAGGAVVAAGVATGFAIHANSQSTSEQNKNPYARDQSIKDSIQTQSTVANVLFISGAVLGAGACVLAFTTQWKTASHTTASLTVGPSLAIPGLTAQGKF